MWAASAETVTVIGSIAQLIDSIITITIKIMIMMMFTRKRETAGEWGRASCH